MFARIVRMNLRPNSATGFTRTLENDVIPVLRKQNGFRDEIAFVAPNGLEAVGISLRAVARRPADSSGASTPGR